MAERWAIDTNILIYAIDPTDWHKHRVSLKILNTLMSKRNRLPLQCLAEFYSATVRKRVLSAMQAAAIVKDCVRLLEIIPYTSGDLLKAIELQARHSFQFFDCLLISTAVRVGCTTLCQKICRTKRVIDGLTVQNPFAMTEAELGAVLE